MQSNITTRRLNQTFETSLQYGQPKHSIIVDNRNTSLLKDYYKLIGSRYKFQLEDWLKQKTKKELEAYQSSTIEYRKLTESSLEESVESSTLRRYLKYKDRFGHLEGD